MEVCPMSLLTKRLMLLVLALPLLAMIALAVFLTLRPVPISNMRVLLNSMLGSGIAAPSAQTVTQRLQVPPGFTVSVYASGLTAPRFLHVTAAGDLLVSSPRSGEVLLLPRQRGADGDGRRVLLRGLDRPHGLDIADGWLYVGERTAVGRVRIDEQSGKLLGEYRHIITGFTGEGNHWTKTVRIGPDGYLYVAQGSTCNVCVERDRRRATIMRFNADGSGGEIYASGLRNSVGMDWAPWDHTLYATDNGRDMLGDDFPPCELNRIEQGGFYGWPYINGFGVLDPDFGKGKEALLKTALSPAFGFRPHNAPLGIHFLRHQPPLPGYERTALVALHGSWNRTVPDGYKVVALHWGADGAIEQRDFLSGFERNGDVIGRPVDVAEAADGAIYVSDDYAGTIYRVSYGAAAAGAGSDAAAAQPAAAVAPQFSALQSAQLRAQGEQLFARYRCGSCHGAQMRGSAPPLHNLRARYDVEQLRAFLQTPAPPMPIFPLSDDERTALAVYLLQK
jgi:glucose/arabinose dehydrogenase